MKLEFSTHGLNLGLVDLRDEGLEHTVDAGNDGDDKHRETGLYKSDLYIYTIPRYTQTEYEFR